VTVKLAKQWFRDHPRSVVSFHRSWDRLPAHSREVLSTPRTARVSGNIVIFEAPASGRSELSLVKVTGTVNAALMPFRQACAASELSLFTDRGEHFITYRAVS